MKNVCIINSKMKQQYLTNLVAKMSYKNMKLKTSSVIPLWQCEQKKVYKNLCLLSVLFAFTIGLLIGILIPLLYLNELPISNNTNVTKPNFSANELRTIFVNNSFAFRQRNQRQLKEINEYPTVSFVEKSDNLLIEDGVYWGKKVERSLPVGYDWNKHVTWSNYVQGNVAVKLENGCGRMQNRLVTFRDGTRGCVRYRQNTDQIQGELFSFYLAQILQIPNLPPSTVTVVNLKNPLWTNLANEIASAQWNSNRPVVITKYINDLDVANIPDTFKPEEKHLNINDVKNITNLVRLIELAQWSDLIIFDYLTANLDRVVNNLYNYQWNVNIMEAPAHNLAKKLDTNLLIFLDNESGLLHGYRLLKKYEIYHTILLDNLCLFRKRTANVIEELKRNGNVGKLLRDIFDKENDSYVKDVLPTLPDKSIKILNERIDKVYNQIVKCKTMFSNNDDNTLFNSV